MSWVLWLWQQNHQGRNASSQRTVHRPRRYVLVQACQDPVPESRFPPDPAASEERSWHVPLGKPVLPRKPDHFYPFHALELDDAQRAEDVKAASFHREMSRVPPAAPRGTARYPWHALELEPGQRVEDVHPDVFTQNTNRPPGRARHRVRLDAGARGSQGLFTTEEIHADAFDGGMKAQPFRRPMPKWLGYNALGIDESTFSNLGVPVLTRYHLSGGFQTMGV